jgi:hypothetical protein
MLLRTFQTWRLNDLEPNNALESLLDRLQRHPRARCVLFTAHFLAVVNDVLQHGQESHPSLFQICDRIAFDFFNPAKVEGNPQRDAMSRLDVALRCARSLFFLSPNAYFGLDDYFRPIMLTGTEMNPIVDDDGYVLGVARAEGAKKPRQRKRKQAAGTDEDGDLEAFVETEDRTEPTTRQGRRHRAEENQDGEASSFSSKPRQGKRKGQTAMDDAGDREESVKRHRRRKPRENENSDEDDDRRRERKRLRKEEKRHRRRHRGDEATRKEPAGSDSNEMFVDADGRTCVVGDDGLVYQVQGDAESGYYYIFQPGTADPTAQGESPPAAAESLARDHVAAGGDYRDQQDDAIRKLQDARTIEEPHLIEPPLTLEFFASSEV